MTELKEDYLDPSLDHLPNGSRLVVIDFSATWCGPCKRQDPVFRRVASAFGNEAADEPVTFLTVDVDRNQALARAYKVKSVPTTLVMAQESSLFRGIHWREKARFQGVIPYPTLKQTVSEHLEDL